MLPINQINLWERKQKQQLSCRVKGKVSTQTKHVNFWKLDKAVTIWKLIAIA